MNCSKNRIILLALGSSKSQMGKRSRSLEAQWRFARVHSGRKLEEESPIIARFLPQSFRCLDSSCTARMIMEKFMWFTFPL
jgi:hypothetical protein